MRIANTHCNMPLVDLRLKKAIEQQSTQSAVGSLSEVSPAMSDNPPKTNTLLRRRNHELICEPT